MALSRSYQLSAQPAPGKMTAHSTLEGQEGREDRALQADRPPQGDLVRRHGLPCHSWLCLARLEKRNQVSSWQHGMCSAYISHYLLLKAVWRWINSLFTALSGFPREVTMERDSYSPAENQAALHIYRNEISVPSLSSYTCHPINLHHRADWSHTGNSAGEACGAADATRYFRVMLLLWKEMYQEFIFTFHSGMLGNRCAEWNCWALKYLYLFKSSMKG